MVYLIPYIVTGLILYDLSIHIVYLIKKQEYVFKKNLHWWPKWDSSTEQGKHSYQVFWSTYWGTAFVLMIIYLTFKA
jgi:hypothetical protein